jgi:predicted small lipoprotein YifL
MVNNPLRTFSLALMLAALFTIAGCGDHRMAPAPSALPNATFFTLTDNNQLVRFNSQSLATPGTPLAITGLGQGEQLLDIDFRPANNMLYGVSSGSRVYSINTTTGVATVAGTAPFSPALRAGASIAIDFNPTVDRLRLVGSTGQNLRLNVDTGVAVNPADGDINGVTGASITDVAYTNNVPTATTTVLYDLDPVTDRLYQQVPPNNGTLAFPLYDGLDFTTTNGFDISPSGQAIAGLTIGGTVELISITVATGKTQKLGNLPANTIALAIPTN